MEIPPRRERVGRWGRGGAAGGEGVAWRSDPLGLRVPDINSHRDLRARQWIESIKLFHLVTSFIRSFSFSCNELECGTIKLPS